MSCKGCVYLKCARDDDPHLGRCLNPDAPIARKSSIRGQNNEKCIEYRSEADDWIMRKAVMTLQEISRTGARMSGEYLAQMAGSRLREITALPKGARLETWFRP